MKNTDKAEIIDKLEAERVKLKREYADVAKAAGMSRTGARGILNGDNGGTSDNLIALAQALGYRVVLQRARRETK